MYYTPGGLTKGFVEFAYDGDLNIVSRYLRRTILDTTGLQFIWQMPIFAVKPIIMEKFKIKEKEFNHIWEIVMSWGEYENNDNDKDVSISGWQIERDGKLVKNPYLISEKEIINIDTKKINQIVNNYKEKEAEGFYKGNIENGVPKLDNVLYLDVGKDESKLPSMSNVTVGDLKYTDVFDNKK